MNLPCGRTRRRSKSAKIPLFAAFALLALAGCSELRARQRGREGNRYFQEGNYAAAVQAYSTSEQLYPLAVVALNKGLACRQLLLPGAKTTENERATDCALRAFTRLKQLSPQDARADQLYQQTLFDADRFEELVVLFQKQLARSPDDPAAINALVQVYSRWGRWDEALRWTEERALRRAQDAEAHYAVGVFVYNRLFEKGGGPDRSSYDPRPSPEPKPAPAFAHGDIVGAQRSELAERGIAHLKRALELRPGYADALTYLGLLYRQKSFAYFNEPSAWQTAVDSAEFFRQKAMAAHAEHAGKH
jgi:tetratricopeptide (TPR) repeat protein